MNVARWGCWRLGTGSYEGQIPESLNVNPYSGVKAVVEYVSPSCNGAYSER